jgi:hypothetical protein
VTLTACRCHGWPAEECDGTDRTAVPSVSDVRSVVGATHPAYRAHPVRVDQPAPPAGSRRTVLVAAGVVVALLAAPWVAVAVIVWRAWRPW